MSCKLSTTAGEYIDFDRRFVDGLVNATGAFTEVCSQVIKLFQTGQVRRYALWFMLGALALLWYLV